MGNPVSLDITARTFQFFNGNNLSGVSFGVGKNTPKTSYYGTLLVGNDFGNKQPCAVGLGFIERKYNTDNKKVWFSRELYGEAMKQKGVFDSKITYTPAKVNAQLGKVNVSFTPRVATHFNKDGVTPKIETLTTVAAPLTKDNRLSGYAMYQTYDTTKLFNKGSHNNMSFNVGLTYKLK